MSSHRVLLIDANRAWSEAVAEFLSEGYRANDTLLLAITPKHWSMLNDALERGECPVAPAMSAHCAPAASHRDQAYANVRPVPVHEPGFAVSV